MADEPIDDDDSAAAKSVAADIASFGKSRVLTDVEKEQQRLLFEVRDRQRIRWEQECRIAHQREQAETAAQAEREAAFAAEQHRQRVSREIVERGQSRQQVGSIYDRLTRAEQFRNHAVAHARQQAAINQRQALLDDLQRDIDNLKPRPQPTVIVERPEEDPPWRLGPGFDPKARRW